MTQPPAGVKSPASSAPDLQVAGLCLDVLPVWGRHIETVVGHCQSAVGELLTNFRSVEAELRRLGGDASLQAGSALENIYLNLQYQDRISQMLTLVRSDMARLQELLQQGGTARAADFDGRAWLERLESQYAMAEQHHTASDPNDPDGGIEHF